jgi:hypothetical protein
MVPSAFAAAAVPGTGPGPEEVLDRCVSKEEVNDDTTRPCADGPLAEGQLGVLNPEAPRVLQDLDEACLLLRSAAQDSYWNRNVGFHLMVPVSRSD